MADWGRIGTGIVTGGLSELWNPSNYGLPGMGDPVRSGGIYEGIDQGNFQLPGAAAMSNRDNYIGGGAGRDAQGWQNTQHSVANNLYDQMRGKDSLSALQLRQASDQNIADQRSMAASATPGNAALMNLQAMQGAGRINQGYAGQAAMAGVAERNAAAQTLGGLATAGRGQSLGQQDSAYGRQLQNAGMQQQGNQAYEANRTSRYGASLGVPTMGEAVLGAAAQGAKFAAMAKGGVVDSPTHALVGEAGPEAVIPLAQLPSLMAQMQQAGVVPQAPSTTAPGVVATRTKTSNGAAPPAPPQQATGRRGVLPGELAKFGPPEASKFVLAPPPPPPLPLGYNLGKRK